MARQGCSATVTTKTHLTELAKAQYVTVLATLGLNGTLSIAMNRDAYGGFAVVFLGTLFVVHLFDPGSNALYVSGAATFRETVQLKARAALVGCFVVSATCMVSGRGIGYALASPALLVAYVLFTTVDARFLNQQAWAQSTRCRVIAGVGLCLVPLAAVTIVDGGEVAVFAVALCFASSAFVAGDLHDRLKLAWLVGPRKGGTVVLGRLAASAALNLPNNIVANGLVLVVGLAGSDSEAANSRLVMLAAGAVMAVAPAAPLQMLAAGGAGSRLRVQTTVLLFVAAGLAASVVPIAVPLLYGESYPGLAAPAATAILTVPFISTMLAKLQLSIATWDVYRSSLVATVSILPVLGIAMLARPVYIIPLSLNVLAVTLGLLLAPSSVTRRTAMLEVVAATLGLGALGVFVLGSI